MRLSDERFRELVAEALDRLPPEFLRRMNNVEVVVEDYPDAELRSEFPGLLLGLYRGTPLSRRSWMATGMPDIIYLYKRNIERICRSERQIRSQVRRTVMHEIGHHFGLEETQLEDI